MSLKTRFLIANILMSIGAVFAAFDILYDVYTGFNNESLPIVIILAFVFMIAGIVFRFTLVKCPFCDSKIVGHKKAPDKCPQCGAPSNEKP